MQAKSRRSVGEANFRLNTEIYPSFIFFSPLRLVQPVADVYNRREPVDRGVKASRSRRGWLRCIVLEDAVSRVQVVRADEIGRQGASST